MCIYLQIKLAVLYTEVSGEESENDLEEPEEIELFAPDEPEDVEDTRTFISTGLILAVLLVDCVLHLRSTQNNHFFWLNKLLTKRMKMYYK